MMVFLIVFVHIVQINQVKSHSIQIKLRLVFTAVQSCLCICFLNRVHRLNTSKHVRSSACGDGHQYRCNA